LWLNLATIDEGYSQLENINDNLLFIKRGKNT